MTPDLEHALERAAQAIRGAERIGFVGHIGPDGDALGSMLGLAIAAREQGREVYASFGEPFVVPAEFRFLDLSPLVPPGDFPDDLDVVVACDTASADRLGSILPSVKGAKTLVVVDHHVSNGGFGDIVVIDPAAAATAQLAYYLLRVLGWDISEPVATALYTGLVTDTGRFQYSNTSVEVHRVVQHLLEAGTRPETVGRHIYEEAAFGYLAVAGAVLGRANLDAERRLVWSVVYRSDLEAADVGIEEADGLIDLIRIAREAEVACLLKSLEPGQTKGSLRSRGEVDVGAVAAALGGGGHRNAAGFTFAGDPEEVIERIRSLLS